MSDKVETTETTSNFKSFFVPELGVAVQARTAEEAVAKAKKAAKENK